MKNDYILREDALDFLIPAYDLDISAQDQRIIGDRFEEFLKSIPAADVRPVVRSRWIEIDDYVLCANCGTAEHGPNRNFCHNCGADMREEVSDNDQCR